MTPRGRGRGACAVARVTGTQHGELTAGPGGARRRGDPAAPFPHPEPAGKRRMNNYKPVGKIGEGTFSDVLKTLSLRDGKYYACKHMKQHFESMEQVNNLREVQALRRLSPHPNILMLHEVVFFQPLFPGSNELDQISKIHDVIGTPANETLSKFKQSRIASFDFPFKKGKGIPPLVHNLSPKGFSLLYAMIKYDPDERIAAHQALQHPYFQELWAADPQPMAMHKKLRLLGNTAGQVPLQSWQISKESQRQYSLRKVQEKTKQQHGPPHGELPKLNLSGVAKLTSCPALTFHPVFGAPKESGETPSLQSVRFIGSNVEQSEKQKACRSSPKYFHLPAIKRRGGGGGGY